VAGVSAVLGKTSGNVLADNFRQLCFMQVEPLNQASGITRFIVFSKKRETPNSWQ